VLAGSLTLAAWRPAMAAETEDLTVFDFDATPAATPAFSATPAVSTTPAVSATPMGGAAPMATLAASPAPVTPSAAFNPSVLPPPVNTALEQASPSPSVTISASPTPTSTTTPTVLAPETAIVQIEAQEPAEGSPEAKEPSDDERGAAALLVERAGELAQADELRVDGKIQGVKTGGSLLVAGDIGFLNLADGHSAVPGQEFLSYRLSNPVLDPVTGADLGRVVTVSGVLKVIRVDGDEVQVRVRKTYVDIRVGDSVRRRGEKPAHAHAKTLPGDLSGYVAAVHDSLGLAYKGVVVYLDLGSDQGIEPGLRFTVSRPAAQSVAQEFLDSTSSEANGDLGVVEVISVLRNTCTARVIKDINVIKPGDHVRLR
jgi:hypothetical protein